MINATQRDVMDTNILDQMTKLFDAAVAADAARAERMKDPEYVKQLQQQAQAQRDAAVGRVEDRAQLMCDRAIGKRMSVKKQNGMITEGVIIEAKPAGVRHCPRTVVARFDIVMECGVKKVRREFTVERLPQ